MSTDPTLPASLAAELADLKRRIDNLERSPSLPYSSTKGGKFTFLGNSGEDRFALGNVTVPQNPSGGEGDKYGVFAYGDGGAIAFGAREGNRGLVYPNLPAPFFKTSDVVTVTSGTFVSCYYSIIDTPPGEVLVVRVQCDVPAATGGRIKLVAYGDDSSITSTNEFVIGANFFDDVQFEWLHPAVVGWGDTRLSRPRVTGFSVEAYRTAGAGTINIYPPFVAYFTSLEFAPDADSTGNPHTV